MKNSDRYLGRAYNLIFRIFILLLLSACGVTPKPQVQATGSKAKTEKNSTTAVTACTAANCQALKLTVNAKPIQNNILKGYIGQPVNWQFSLDAKGTRNVGVYLSGAPQSWTNGIPNQIGSGTFTVTVRDLQSCKATEKDPSICANVQKELPNYDGKGTFNFQILPPSSVPLPPVCSTPSVGSILGGLASVMNPLAFIPVSIVNGVINSGNKTGC